MHVLTLYCKFRLLVYDVYFIFFGVAYLDLFIHVYYICQFNVYMGFFYEYSFVGSSYSVFAVVDILLTLYIGMSLMLKFTTVTKKILYILPLLK